MNMLSYTIVGYEITMGRNLITYFLSGTWYELQRVESLSIYGKLLKCVKFFSIFRLGGDCAAILFTSHRDPHRFSAHTFLVHK